MANSKLNRLVSIIGSISGTLLEFVISILLTVSLAPTLLLLWFINELVRLIITTVFSFQARNGENPKRELLSEGSDGIWGFQKQGNSRNIVILYVYNSYMCLENFRRNYDKKVIEFVDSKGCKPYSKLKKIFKKKFGYYCWEENKNFRIEDHIRNISEDDHVVTEREVMKYMSSLMDDMNENKPQWEEILVPKFAYDEDIANGTPDCIPARSARIYRSHHAFMDGCSNLLMAGACMGDTNSDFPYVVDPTAPIHAPLWKLVYFKITCAIFALITIVKSLYFASRIKSRFLMKNYSGKQKFAWSPALDLSMIRGIKDKTKVSVPAILCSATIGALKKLDETFPFQGNNSPATSSVTKSTSLGLVGAVLPYPDINPRNRFTVVNFTMTGSREVNRLTRLATTQKEMRKLTQSPDGLVAYHVFQFFGKLPAVANQWLLSGARTPVIYSNVPWASQIVKLWDQEVNDVAGWMPLLTAAGMGLLSVTYSDKVRICLIVDENCLSDTEVKFLLGEVQNEVRQLYEECSPMTHFNENGIQSV